MRNSPRLGGYTVESAEHRGSVLEQAYAELLGGEISGGFNDGGVDVTFDDLPGIPGVQVKNTWAIAEKFLAASVEKSEFIPIVVGDPGQYTKYDVLLSIKENGGWVGFDVPNREKLITKIRMVRDYILNHGGHIKAA